MKKTLKDIKPEAGTIRELIIEDADGDLQYIKDVADNGCSGGTCRSLIYYTDTHAFFNDHADEIQEILERVGDEMGQPYDITLNMKRLGQTDLRNFLAWLAYEAEAQEIVREIEGL